MPSDHAQLDAATGPLALLPEKQSFSIRALLIGDRIDPQIRLRESVVGQYPLTMRVDGGGIAVVFRYGAVVFFAVAEDARQQLIEQIRPLVQNWRAVPEAEEMLAAIEPGASDGLENNLLRLRNGEVRRLQVVAVVMSRSVVLADYESRIADSFDQIEPLAGDLQRHGRSRRSTRQLLQHIGGSLLSQQRMIGRVEVGDKPELLWEHSDLDQLYLRIEDELEIRERYAILQRKLDLISHTAQTALELVHTRRSLRVEWYIVILIVVEIVLIVYDMFWKS
jgi:uncharacterized Rmd1/YagE family protein